MNCNSSLDSASSHLMMSWILWSSMLLVMLPVTGSMVVCRGGAVANDEERKAALANRDVARTDRDTASTIYPQ